MSDGGLRQLYREHLKDVHLVAIETGATALGVPDSEFCFDNGEQGWIENKFTAGWAVKFQPAQIAWLMRRSRMGGRCFIGVRRTNKRLGKFEEDNFYLIKGEHAALVRDCGLRGCKFVGMWKGGPSKWDWQQIELILRGRVGMPRQYDVDWQMSRKGTTRVL